MINMSEFLAELIGTMVLVVFGGGVVASNILNKSKGAGGGWVLITLGWGLGVTLGVYAVGDVSGAHLNPAVTLGFASIGEFPWESVLPYITAQIIGAVIGAIIVFFVYLPHWAETKEADLKLAVYATAPAIRSPLSNLTAEIIGTFALLLGLLFIGANEFTEGLNPLVVGALIVAIGMSLGGPTGYAINPARDLGPRIAHAILPIPGKGGSDWGYAWVPIAGPAIGGIYGALFYQAVFTGVYTWAFWAVSGVIAFILVAATVIELKKASTNAADKKKVSNII